MAAFASRSGGFGGTSRARGTIKLRTLRAPGVKTLKGMFDRKQLDDEHLGYADDAMLDPMINLLQHHHAFVRTKAEAIIMNLEKEEEDVVLGSAGFKDLYQLLQAKDVQSQSEAMWTIAILGGNTDLNHDALVKDVGWLTLVHFADRNKVKKGEEETQRAAVTAISNLCLNEEMHEMIIKEGGLALLKDLAKNTDDIRLKRPIANAFANLASDEETVHDVISDGGLELMIKFANEDDDELVCGAIHTIANLADAEEMKEPIVAAGGLEVVVKLLHSRDAMIVKGATNALANLATVEKYQYEMIRLGCAAPLTGLAKKSKNPEIQLRVAIAINNLCSNPELREDMRSAGVVRPLRSLARSRNPEIKREAIEALTELGETIGGRRKRKGDGLRSGRDGRAGAASSSSNADDDRAPGLPPRDPADGDDDDDARRRRRRERKGDKTGDSAGDDEAARAAAAAALAEAEARAAAEREAREKAEREAREAAMRAAAEAEARRLAEDEARRRLEEERRKMEEARLRAEELARQHAESLANMKEQMERDAEARRRAEEEARLRLEEEARRRAEEEAQRAIAAAEAARRAAEEEARAQMLAAEAARREAEEAEARRRREAKADKTGDALGDDEEEDDIQTEEDKRVLSELAQIMVELWEPKSHERVENALNRLLVLAQTVRNRKLIRIAGAIPLLCSMLKKADPTKPLSKGQSLALEAIAILSKNVLNREEIRKAGGLSPLVSFIHKKEQKDQLEAFKALKECGKSAKNKVLLRKAGFIESLIPFMLPDNELVQCLVLDVICVVNLNDPQSQQIVRDAGGLTPLMNLLNSPKVEIKKRAVRTLGAVAGNNRKIQAIIRKAKILPTVVHMLRADQDPELQKAAAGACASIGDNDYSNQNAIRRHGGIKLILQQLTSSNDSVKEQACAAIRSLCKQNTKIQNAVREAGAIPTLIKMLEAPSQSTLIHATGAMMEVARDNTKNQDALCFGGTPPLLVAGLQTNSTVLQYLSCGCIWSIARKSRKRRDAFRKAKAEPPLRLLVNSTNDQVKRGATWALEALLGKK